MCYTKLYEFHNGGVLIYFVARGRPLIRGDGVRRRKPKVGIEAIQLPLLISDLTKKKVCDVSDIFS